MAPPKRLESRKNISEAPVASLTPFVWGASVVGGLGDPIGEQRWTMWCPGIKGRIFQG